MTKLSTTESNRAVGRRKRASARVRITKGTGKFVINGMEMKESLTYFESQDIVMAPLKAMAKEKDLDISCLVQGGGKKGQAVAIQLGIARALVLWNEEFRKTLKTQGYLTRDPRIKERKKFGLKKARRAAQWSKR
jgi:small subunit ribosomal protein S9